MKAKDVCWIVSMQDCEIFREEAAVEARVILVLLLVVPGSTTVASSLYVRVRGMTSEWSEADVV